MARRPDQNNIFDVSLFEQSPIDDTHFNFPRPAISHATMDRPQIHISSWDEIPEEFRPLPPNLRKPLPPLPTFKTQSCEQETHGRPKKSKSEGEGRRNFWSRIKRSKSESHHEPIREVPTWPAGTGFEAPWSFESPQIPGAPGPSHTVRRSQSSQLIWMPQEQMWLVSDPDPSSNQASNQWQDEHRSRHTYQAEPRPEYLNDASLYDGSANPFDPPPPYSRSESASYSTLRSNREAQWDVMARRIHRPSSAGP
jgi:hypothetical protein